MAEVKGAMEEEKKVQEAVTVQNPQEMYLEMRKQTLECRIGNGKRSSVNVGLKVTEAVMQMKTVRRNISGFQPFSRHYPNYNLKADGVKTLKNLKGACIEYL